MNPNRFFFEVAYNGAAYNGWQVQPGQKTVQGVIEDCLAKFVVGFEGITASGRTDTGVHCESQYFHADIPEELSDDNVQYKLNRMLPPDVAIKSIRKVKPDAHARFDALSRSYEYRMVREKDPFHAGQMYWYEKDLFVGRMNQAAQMMLSEENFESFSKVRTEVNHFLCNISRAEWVEEGRRLTFHITANRFLRGMVRAVVGTLLQIGEGKRQPTEMKEIIEARDRRKAGPAAPPEGLFLVNVSYPEEIYLD